MTYLLLRSHRMCPLFIPRYFVEQIVGGRLDSSSDCHLLCRHLIPHCLKCLIAYPHVDCILLHLWLSYVNGLLGPVSLAFLALLTWQLGNETVLSYGMVEISNGPWCIAFAFLGHRVSWFVHSLSAVSVHAVHIILCCPGASDDVILSFIHRLRPSQTIAAFALVQKCQIYLLLLFRFIHIIALDVWKMPVKFLCSSSPNLLGHIVHTFIASRCLVDPLPFWDLLSIVINAGFFCWCDRRYPCCPCSLLLWLLRMIFFFIFLLPSALPHPIHMYSFEMLWPDTSYINRTTAWLYNCVHFVNLYPLLLDIVWTFDQLSYDGTQKESCCCFQSKHCYSVRIIALLL